MTSEHDGQVATRGGRALPAGAAGFALAAALISVVVVHVLGAESQLITAGLVGFNPIPTAIALSTGFYRPSPRVAAYARFAIAFPMAHGSAAVFRHLST